MVGRIVNVFCLMADIVALAAAVTELLNHTRRARTALWCAVQMTSAECALTDSTSHDAAACHRAMAFVTDNWRSPVPTTEHLDAAQQKKC